MEEESTESTSVGFLFGLLFGAVTALSWASGDPLLYVPVTLLTGILALSALIPKGA